MPHTKKYSSTYWSVTSGRKSKKNATETDCINWAKVNGRQWMEKTLTASWLPSGCLTYKHRWHGDRAYYNTFNHDRLYLPTINVELLNVANMDLIVFYVTITHFHKL